jgi:hypothetical protein
MVSYSLAHAICIRLYVYHIGHMVYIGHMHLYIDPYGAYIGHKVHIMVFTHAIYYISHMACIMFIWLHIVLLTHISFIQSQLHFRPYSYYYDAACIFFI